MSMTKYVRTQMELNGWDEAKAIEIFSKFVHSNGLNAALTKFCGEVAEQEEETGNSATGDESTGKSVTTLPLPHPYPKCKCPDGGPFESMPACEWCKARNRALTTDPVVGSSRQLRNYLKSTLGKTPLTNYLSLSSVKMILGTLSKDTLLAGYGKPESLLLEIDYLIEQYDENILAKNFL